MSMFGVGLVGAGIAVLWGCVRVSSEEASATCPKSKS